MWGIVGQQAKTSVFSMLLWSSLTCLSVRLSSLHTYLHTKFLLPFSHFSLSSPVLPPSTSFLFANTAHLELKRTSSSSSCKFATSFPARGSSHRRPPLSSRSGKSHSWKWREWYPCFLYIWQTQRRDGLLPLSFCIYSRNRKKGVSERERLVGLSGRRKKCIPTVVDSFLLSLAMGGALKQDRQWGANQSWAGTWHRWTSSFPLG